MHTPGELSLMMVVLFQFANTGDAPHEIFVKP